MINRLQKRGKSRKDKKNEGSFARNYKKKGKQCRLLRHPILVFSLMICLFCLVVLDFPLPNSASSAPFPLPTNVSVFHRPLETPKKTSVPSAGRSLQSILTLSSDSEEPAEREENSKEQTANSIEQIANSKEQNNPPVEQAANSIETFTPHPSNSIEHSIDPRLPPPPTPSDSIESDLESVIQFSKDAPAAPILGPFCVICGKFGQYVCDRTDQDVCSLECKRKAEEAALSSPPSDDSPAPTPSIAAPSVEPRKETEVLRVLPTAPQFLPSKNRWKDGISPLDSRKCPICGKTGHLAQDCHFASGKRVEFVGFGRNEEKGEEAGYGIECESLPEWQRREVGGKEIMKHSCRSCFGNAEKRLMTLRRVVLYVENEEI